MGQQQSKDELLYQQVNNGNSEGIKSLSRDGAGLEWIDREGKTPLIVACMNPELYDVAKTLIELGANVNAYQPGRRGGTPLHHAAKRGLEHTVHLLLSHGANALIMNDCYQSPLDVARAKGFNNIVRAIEGHICLFSGWMREFYGPGFLEALAPQLVSRKVWVVVLPCGSRKHTQPSKLELATYPTVQDAQPRTLIALWKANLEEPKIHHSDPSVTILDNSTISRGRRRRRREARCRPQTLRQMHIKLAPANEGDKQQLQWFCNACKGIPQEMHPTFLHNTPASVVPATAPPDAEDLELAVAISASIHSCVDEKPTLLDAHPSSGASASTSLINCVYISSPSRLDVSMASAPLKGTSSLWAVNEAGPIADSTQKIRNPNGIRAAQTMIQAPDSVPSIPPIANEIIDDGPIHYPSIDSTPVDISSSGVENLPGSSGERKEEEGGSSSCVICLDAQIEAACIPCGHMAGCMSCLNEIKAKKWGCPVCRAKINQVIRLYAV